jgi:hypothetical protein
VDGQQCLKLSLTNRSIGLISPGVMHSGKPLHGRSEDASRHLKLDFIAISEKAASLTGRRPFRVWNITTP